MHLQLLGVAYVVSLGGGECAQLLVRMLHLCFPYVSESNMTSLFLTGTFWTNPQFRVSIIDPDEDDDDGNGSIIVGLMQKERRKMRMEGKDNQTIGYAIYEVPYLSY